MLLSGLLVTSQVQAGPTLPPPYSWVSGSYETLGGGGIDGADNVTGNLDDTMFTNFSWAPFTINSLLRGRATAATGTASADIELENLCGQTCIHNIGAAIDFHDTYVFLDADDPSATDLEGIDIDLYYTGTYALGTSAVGSMQAWINNSVLTGSYGGTGLNETKSGLISPTNALLVNLGSPENIWANIGMSVGANSMGIVGASYFDFQLSFRAEDPNLNLCVTSIGGYEQGCGTPHDAPSPAPVALFAFGLISLGSRWVRRTTG